MRPEDKCPYDIELHRKIWLDAYYKAIHDANIGSEPLANIERKEEGEMTEKEINDWVEAHIKGPNRVAEAVLAWGKNIANKFYNIGHEKAQKDTIERACDTLFAMLPIMVSYYNEDIHEHADRGEFIKQFRMKMEEQK